MKKRWLSVLEGVLLAVAVVCLVELVLIAVHGGRWQCGPFSARQPGWRLLLFGLCLAAWIILRYRFSRGQGWGRALGRIALVVLSTTAAFLAAEAILRHHLRETQGFTDIRALRDMGAPANLRVTSTHPLSAIIHLSSNRRLVYELRSDMDIKFGNHRVHLNGAGLRESREYAVEKPSNTLRIVGIGDSGMFGWAVEQGEDYLSVLESNLARRAGPCAYEVLNFAVPGYNTEQEVEILRSKALAYGPDVVIVGWCVNDLDTPFFMYKRNEFRRRDVSYLFELVFNRERYADLIQPAVRPMEALDPTVADPELLSYAGVEGEKKALKELAELSRERGFRVLVFGALPSGMRCVCEELGISCCSTLVDIPKGRYPHEYGVHFMHPRAPGHRVLAEYLEQVLDSRGWLVPNEQQVL